jgi:hypothetical protein
MMNKSVKGVAIYVQLVMEEVSSVTLAVMIKENFPLVIA